MDTSPHLRHMTLANWTTCPSMLSPSLCWGGSAGLPKGPPKPPNIAQAHGAFCIAGQSHIPACIILFLGWGQHCIAPFLRFRPSFWHCSCNFQVMAIFYVPFHLKSSLSHILIDLANLATCWGARSIADTCHLLAFDLSLGHSSLLCFKCHK